MKKILLIALISIFSLSAFAKSEFTKAYSKENIHVYTRPVQGSPMDEFKGETIVNSPIYTCYYAIENYENHKDWMKGTTQSKLIKKLSDNELILYYVTDVPWPFTDRSSLLKRVRKINLVDKSIRFDFENTDNTIFPEKKYYRMNDIKGFWELVAISKDKTKVTYSIKANPGGNIPSKIANMKSKKKPYNTIKGLIKEINKTEVVNNSKVTKVYKDFIKLF